MTLAGLAVPTPTLFDDEGRIDPERNRRYTDGVCRAGVDHVFALSSLGEFPSVDSDERPGLLTAVRDGLHGAADLWVGVGAPSTRRAVRHAVGASEAGADVLIATPPYYLRPTDAEIQSYYRAIGHATDRLVLAYNNPARVGYPLSPTLVHSLAQEGVIVGIKDAAGSFESLEGFLTDAPPGFDVLAGDDRLARRALGAGAAGAVMGLANVAPRLAVEFLRSIGARNESLSNELEGVIEEVARVIATGPFPSTTKFLAARLRGAPEGYRAPYETLTPLEQARVLGALAPIEPRLRRWLG
jgi:dihydrodipicolinate synthase/N-acetylneuraminate lyase